MRHYIWDIFNAKLRFAFLASLRSAILSEFYVGNLLFILPARVKKQNLVKQRIIIFNKKQAYHQN